MKKVLTGLLILSYSFLFTSCDKNESAGPITTVSKNLDDYNELEIDGAMELEIIAGMNDDIRIIAPDNMQKYIETYVFSNRLVINERDNNIKHANIRIEISETALSYLIINGSGNIYGDTIISNNVMLEIAGSGKIDLPVRCTELSTRIDGSGRLKVIGEAKSVDARIEGSGIIDVKNVESSDASARIDGSGSIDIYANTSFFARISGSGAIRYWGDPESTDTNISGSGTIISIN